VSLRIVAGSLGGRRISTPGGRGTRPTPEVVREEFHFVLADVLRAPFADHAFDTVVTPWLIDIVSDDLPVFAARINRLLKPGGRWLNFGSLAFDHPDSFGYPHGLAFAAFARLVATVTGGLVGVVIGAAVVARDSGGGVASSSRILGRARGHHASARDEQRPN